MSPFENLAKILTQEQSKGCTNGLVIGGLEAFVGNWARNQNTNTPAQNELVNQITESLRGYSQAPIDARRQMIGRVFALIQAIGPATPARPRRQERRPIARPASPPPADATPSNVEIAPLLQEPVEGAEEDEEEEDEAPRVLTAREAGFGLDAPVIRMQGVGPQRAKLLANLGIEKVRDLLYLFPRRYDDYSRLQTISQLMYGNEATIIARVGVVNQREMRGKRIITNVLLVDQTGSINANFYNVRFLNKQLRPGMQVVIHGRVDRYMNRVCFTHPDWERLSKDAVGILPVYPLTDGLNSRWLRRLVRGVVGYWADKVADPIPANIRKRAGLVDLTTALREVHFPSSWENVKPARRRLAFEELLIHQMGIQRQRQQWQASPGRAFQVAPNYQDEVLPRILPFELTSAQKRVIGEILADMSKPEPMHRLLQGDVGSGKTVVALAAMLCAVQNGTQAALMAPTEILAEQHFKTISRILEDTRFNLPVKPHIERLVGSLTPGKKARVQLAIAAGEVDLIVGTHALIQEAVHFKDLGLAVIDEQHRFGVNQRRMMQEQSAHPELTPDVIVMSATPIPQTLALTVFGDLDISIIDEMPPGRQAIRTKWLEPPERERAYAFIRKQVNEGRQAYVICPLVEESEVIDAKAAVEEYERLRKEIYPDLNVGLIHGKLRASEKDAVMTNFAAGRIHVLVATSVIEVGIDVPNATVMLIEGADRFGLAQLHQFRGRIGRGQYQSYCMLLAEKSGSTSDERLRVIEETQNGFILAEADLSLRGPGEIRNRLGARQSGAIDFKIATLNDIKLLQEAQAVARGVFEADPKLDAPEHQLLKQKMEEFWRKAE
ncbi:MAG: ATP-dependent DNA helicase RecG [Anaerolineae bacterium]